MNENGLDITNITHWRESQMIPTHTMTHGDKALHYTGKNQKESTSEKQKFEKPKSAQTSYTNHDISQMIFYLLSNRPVLSLKQIHRVLTKYYPNLQIGRVEAVILELLLKEEIEEIGADEFTLI